jgi:signal transduction histidine kinase
VVIHRDFDKAIPPIRGDEERIKQVFINLLNNARDAIGRNGTIRVVTRLDQSRREIQIIVADTGRGITAKNIDKIFDPFFTTKPVNKGTGMGLSISFGIVREHHGVIEVESPPSEATRRLAGASAEGTAFSIRFPLAGSTTDGES